MKLFIWEGGGISDAYHDDGTLVVLAETPEQARQVIRDKVAQHEREAVAWAKERDELWERTGQRTYWGKEGQALLSRQPPYRSQFFDGSDEALNREPDRVVELDKPTWVAFNGGGYD